MCTRGISVFSLLRRRYEQRASLFLRDVIDSALKKNVDARTASAAAMLQQLETALRAGLSKLAVSLSGGGAAGTPIWGGSLNRA
jgi:hypothetical protein